MGVSGLNPSGYTASGGFFLAILRSTGTAKRPAIMSAIVGLILFGTFAMPAPASAAPITSCVAGVCTVTFSPSASPQGWSIPLGVSSVTMSVAGGSGGSPPSGLHAGGAGGSVTATLTVVPGHNLSVVVGGAGASGVVAPFNSPSPGGYGGGGYSGTEKGPVADPGGGGGGGSFVFDTTGAVILVVAGGGGGASGGASGGAGGIGGPGGAALPPGDPGPVPGGAATTSAPGAGGPNLDPGGKAGQPGTGAVTDDNNFGRGGDGGSIILGSFAATPGGGGGGYYGGGGGGTDTLGDVNAAGGGGSGYLVPGASVVSTGLHFGDGMVTISYVEPPMTTTSGVLLDADTGAAIPNSCVVFSPANAPGQTNYTNVHGDGRWSFTSSNPGPFNVAFYTTANGDCSQPILPTPVPSWYINQVLTGNDEHTIVPPPNAATVQAGSSSTIACLGATEMPTGPCATPSVGLSGTVIGADGLGIAGVCVFVVAENGEAGAVTDASGNWTIAGIPATFTATIAFLAGFGPPESPCDGDGDGDGPPVPAPGALQPVFLGNVWADLSDPDLFEDTFAWAVEHGATVLNGPSFGLVACLTTAPGSVVPRPSCAAAAALPATGTEASPLLIGAMVLGGIGIVMLAERRRRRETLPPE